MPGLFYIMILSIDTGWAKFGWAKLDSDGNLVAYGVERFKEKDHIKRLNNIRLRATSLMDDEIDTVLIEEPHFWGKDDAMKRHIHFLFFAFGALATIHPNTIAIKVSQWKSRRAWPKVKNQKKYMQVLAKEQLGVDLPQDACDAFWMGRYYLNKR